VKQPYFTVGVAESTHVVSAHLVESDTTAVLSVAASVVSVVPLVHAVNANATKASAARIVVFFILFCFVLFNEFYIQ
jgi:hypothetical protein